MSSSLDLEKIPESEKKQLINLILNDVSNLKIIRKDQTEEQTQPINTSYMQSNNYLDSMRYSSPKFGQKNQKNESLDDIK